MKYLVATRETQGERANDFFFCLEGEPVHFGVICDGDSGADSSCGCSRSMIGLSSRKATTTVRVTDVDEMSELAYRSMMIPIIGPSATDDLMFVARSHEVGDVLEYRDSEFSCRNNPQKLYGFTVTTRVSQKG